MSNSTRKSGSDAGLDPDLDHPARDEIDPVTGYDTTGHSWNGIIELNTPMPRVAIGFMLAAFFISVILWILFPAWPLGNTYTKGLLGHDQQAIAVADFERMEARRADWLSRFETPDFAALMADEALMANAMPDAKRLFLDDCAACHGAEATGGPGFPTLADDQWLWSGDPAEIAHTIRVGINGTSPDTRVSQMLNFGAAGMLKRADLEAVRDYVVALPSGKADPESPGAAIFAQTCAACHGEGGAGGLGIGAPSLTDDAVIYGQDPATVWHTLWHGRQGVMPSWEGKLTPAQINLLATYVARLGSEAAGTEAKAE